MKKLGIFGDSYATAITNSPMWPYGNKGWSAILKESDPNNIEVHAKAGASVEWIVDQFKQHYKEFEKNIVIVTSWPRIHFPIELTPKNNDPKWTSEFWANPGMIENVLKNNTSVNNILQKILDWMIWIAFDPSQKNYQNNNVLANCAYLKFLDPGVILIPVMKHKGFDIFEPDIDWCLSDISNYELGLIENPFQQKPMQDFRPNHMGIENNQYFLDYINKRINNEATKFDMHKCYQYKSDEEFWRMKQ